MKCTYSAISIRDVSALPGTCSGTERGPLFREVLRCHADEEKKKKPSINNVAISINFFSDNLFEFDNIFYCKICVRRLEGLRNSRLLRSSEWMAHALQFSGATSETFPSDAFETDSKTTRVAKAET